eukprot:TRINITY_DN1341_c1_g1_i1.p1 TRINITY_DN1341_c1_g1~~TRINITY_DN1341_c1_g1_i1.p1  ORF type:complete len:274 (+),score=67.80 TRINITY_DN1341_c1_g1_i1:161-982(+)
MVAFLLGFLAVGGGSLAFWKRRPRAPPSIPESARAPTPDGGQLLADDGGPGPPQQPDGPSRVCTIGAPEENTVAKAHVMHAVQQSETLDDGDSEDESDADSEEELISGGRASSSLQRGHASLVRDTVQAAWLFEERPSLPQNAPVMHMLPSSASTHLYIIAESKYGWMYVFEKWRDGVCAARFRNPDHAKKYRAGFMGRYRRRKQVTQIASVHQPTAPDGQSLRVSDLLVWSAEHTEFRQLTDNCHTYAANLAAHLGMEPPTGWWEHLLYDTY